MIDLLNSEQGEQGIIGKETIRNLQLDRLVDVFCPNVKKAQLFFDVISKPLLNSRDIMYRQNILKDFLENPGLLPDLLRLFCKFHEIKKQMNESRKANRRFFNNFDFDDNVEGLRNLLKIKALLLKKTLILLEYIFKKIDEYDVCSNGLITLKNEIANIVLQKEFYELLELCSHFELISQSDPFCVQITINDRGRISSCRLSNTHQTAKLKRSKKTQLFSRFEDDNDVKNYIYFQRTNDTTFQEIFTQSYTEIINALEKIYLQIESSFIDCYFALQYYDIAVQYCGFLIASGCNFLFPQVSPDENQSMIGLKDLFLLSQHKDQVIANDFKSFADDISGIIVMGKNSGGKTVYIRSIGTAQIFAQAGLPIVAENALIHCYNTIATQFSESEKYDVHSIAGRFEQEVMEMSEMIDCVQKNSLVLLNEVFQSTAYDEGAELLSAILNYLSGIQSKWILVTHIKQIRMHIPINSVLLQTNEGYKIS